MGLETTTNPPYAGRMARPQPTLARLSDADVAPAASLLARAFFDNPGTEALLKGVAPPRRSRVLERTFHGCVQGARRHGLADVALLDGRLAAASLVFAPGPRCPPLSALPWILWGPLRAGPKLAVRYGRLGAALDEVHPKHPHYYLFVLGAEPELQGRGLGGALLSRLAERADAAGARCYLETDKQSSVKLYERHGFEVTQELEPKGLNVPFWTMTRPARVG